MKRSILILLLVFSLCLSFAACGQKAVTNLTVDSGLAREYALNSTPDFSKVSATATYNDGSTVTVGADELEFSKLDTSKAGKQELTITYSGFSITLDVTIKAAAVSGGNQTGNQGGEVTTPDYYIMAAEMPEALVAFTTNKASFKNQDVLYTVGDANPFMLRQKLLVLDKQAQPVTNMTNYTSVSKVFLMEGTSLTLAGNNYVTIDEENNTFDFTAEAVGKTFRIQTHPAEIEDDMISACTSTLDVKVVAGYNVTNAKDLNLMTTSEKSMHERYPHKPDVNTLQWEVAKEYVDQQFGTGYYDAFGGVNLRGLVLHGDLNVTLNDIPTDYIAVSDDPTKSGFNDASGVFDRYLQGAADSFGIYGNCFTITTRELPLMSQDTAIIGQGRFNSNSWIFRFNVSYSLTYYAEQVQAFNHENYKVLIENLRMRDNDANSDNPAENQHHLFGLNAISLHYVDATYDNLIIEAYPTSTVLNDSNTSLSIKDTVMNNAWQNHIYSWTQNYLQRALDSHHDTNTYKNSAPFPNIKPIELNIENSELTKCGGPVILQLPGSSNACDATVGLNINTDAATKIETTVNGRQAWFTALNRDPYYAANRTAEIMALNPLVQLATGGTMTSAGVTGGSSITTTPAGYEGDYMNMVIASLGGKATYTVDGVVKMSTENAALDPYKATPAPILQSSKNLDAVAIYAGGNSLTFVSGDAASFAEGDTINLYQGTGMAIVLQYYHPTAQ